MSPNCRGALEPAGLPVGTAGVGGGPWGEGGWGCPTRCLPVYSHQPPRTHLQFPSQEKWQLWNQGQRGFPGSSPGKESTCNAEDPGSIPGSERSPGEGIGYPLQYSWASVVALMFKESTCNVGDLSSVPGLGRSPEGGHGNPLQCSCLENPHGQRSLADYIQSMGSQRVGQD